VTEIRIRGITGIPEIRPGDDLAGLIVSALQAVPFGLHGLPADGAVPVFVVAQKVVSKAEGRIVSLDEIEPTGRARAWAEKSSKDPRLVELILRESRRIVRMERGILIVETRHGFVCANGGVDTSNAPAGCAILLPEDPDASARALRTAFSHGLAMDVAVIVSDTFGRPWRTGLTNVAIGLAGISPFVDYRGSVDTCGRTLRASLLAVADELASAAELVMGKTLGIPAAVVEGFPLHGRAGTARELLRAAEDDLFR
jgi:coenzyme F420-0:L-glutamate ligase / coenzyme F420-1:gamma-L-glutamate ligase